MNDARADGRSSPTATARLVLASASPRRQLLLGLLGVPFTVRPVDLDERPLPDESPAATALRLATAKAVAVETVGEEVVLAADTVVILDDRGLGKPADASHAAEMLAALRNRWHRVVTSFALRAPTRHVLRAGSLQTEVHMRAYNDSEVVASIEEGTPLDKAGGYGIQDERLRPVDALEGCYLNVVGLPLCQVNRELNALGVQTSVPTVGESTPPCRLCHAGAELPGIGGVWLLAKTAAPRHRGTDT
jgi:MAF protein